MDKSARCLIDRLNKTCQECEMSLPCIVGMVYSVMVCRSCSRPFTRLIRTGTSSVVGSVGSIFGSEVYVHRKCRKVRGDFWGDGHMSSIRCPECKEKVS